MADNDQKFIQESARAALQNERMKLNQSLMKPLKAGGQIKSSTNEGSKSVNTFRFQARLNSGSTSSEPSELSSKQGESTSFGLCISGNRYTD